MSRAEVLAVVGTRPEAVKTAPVVLALRRDPFFRVRLLSTGQHRELLTDALAAFGLKPDEDLRLMRKGQTPSGVLAAAVAGVDRVLARRRPALVLVQGDTTTSLAAALAAFHRGVPVAHLEAGLRSGDLRAPFPEELNRSVIDRFADLLLAPTAGAARALRAEKAPGRIVVTGNTAVDAVKLAAARARKGGRPYAVVTLHRRETTAVELNGLIDALKAAALKRPEYLWICSVHPRPESRKAFSALKGSPSFRLLPPQPYGRFIHLLAGAEFAFTDSGGLQEEAPTLGVPYLVARRVTERPEGLGRWGVLAGLEPRRVERLLTAWAAKPPRPGKGSPYGDGKSAERVRAALKGFLAPVRKRTEN